MAPKHQKTRRLPNPQPKAPSHKKLLHKHLNGAGRIIILGIGSEFRGDDAAGVIITSRLQKSLHSSRTQKIKFINGSTAPENFTGEIIRFAPSHLVIIDAVEAGRKPGTIFVFEPEDMGEGASFSTHTLPPKIMIDYILSNIDTKILVVGIEPRSLKFGAPVSAEVKKAINAVVRYMSDLS